MTTWLAGGTIIYKTTYQDNIALACKEAELTEACNVGLSIRSILDEMNVHKTQHHRYTSIIMVLFLWLMHRSQLEGRDMWP